MAKENNINCTTGTITYHGPSIITKGNHARMPSRTDAYLSTDERGHIQASCLGGSNKKDNVVPQSADLNHGSYYSMEKGERAVLNNESEIWSEKIAYVSNQPGNRPDAFIVNDKVTYADGQTQDIHLSFANMTNTEQIEINQSLDIYSDMLDTQNPGDSLRSSISISEYSELMEETDIALPNISQMYEEQTSINYMEDWNYVNSADVASEVASAEADWDCDTSSESSIDADATDEGAGIAMDD